MSDDFENLIQENLLLDKEEQVNIKIPIKEIVITSMESNGSYYSSTYVDLLRMYFIACLNLGFIMPEELPDMVDKFTDKIKRIDEDYSNINKFDHYLIKENIIYIDNFLYNETIDNVDFELEFFKAVTEVLLNSNDEHIAISNILTEMIAEKIANMTFNNIRIIIPDTVNENICKTKVTLRAGYQKYNLLITLFKQFCIMAEINENSAICDAMRNSYDYMLHKYFEEFIRNDYSSKLDSIFFFEIMRITFDEEDENEVKIINEYQKKLAVSFAPKIQNFLAFCALITSDDLRNEIIEKFFVK